jgi:hypothetical protein
MIGFIKKLFGSTPAEATQPEAAPYKVETAPAPVAEKATEAVVKSVANPAKKTTPKKPANAKPAGAKKGPRKPKSTKA